MLLSASASYRLTSKGTGSPEGVVTAAVGNIYVQTDAATGLEALWYKATGAGNTGWVSIAGAAGGSLDGTYPNPSVTKIDETGGPTALTIGAIADGEYAQRVGTTLVGGTPSGGGPGLHNVEVTHSVNQALVTGTATLLAFDTELSDTDAMHDPVTNNSRLTVAAGLGGRYAVFALIGFAANTSGIRAMLLLKNATVVRRNNKSLVAGDVTTINLYVELDLAAGDYLELQAYQTSGANLNVVHDPAFHGTLPLFGMRLVG